MARNTAANDWALPVVPDTTTARAGGIGSFSISRNKVKLKDVAWMVGQLATTQGAGLPLYRALGMLAGMRHSSPLGKRLLDVQGAMAEGSSFPEALEAHKRDFGPLVCALVRAGDASGTLEPALRRASDLTEARLRLRRQLRSGLSYPSAVVVFTTVLITVLITMVVPRFQAIYTQTGGKLPAMTRAVVAASHKAPWIAGGVALAVAAGVAVWLRSKVDRDLRRRLDRVAMSIPVTGKLLRKNVNARVAATLSSLLSAGVAVLDTLSYAAETAGNVVYADALDGVRVAISEGRSFSEALASSAVFPDLFTQLVAVGEESGALSDLMERYAKTAEDEVTAATATLVSLIEPAMMVVIGGIVGVFLVALYMPILQLSNQIH